MTLITPAFNNGLRHVFNQDKAASLSLFKPLDPEKEREFQNSKAVLNQTLAAMKNSKNQIGQQKKAMAQDKITRIKEAIKNLKQMSFMDKKAVARMAARLARELASAIKEYASAGATYTEISSASAQASPVQTSPAHAEPVQAAPVQAEANTEAVQTETDAATEAAQAEKNPFQAYEKTQKFGTKEENGTKIIRKKDDNSTFIKDAKQLLEELRGLIKGQRKKTGLKSFFTQKHDNQDDQPLKEAEKALQQADRALSSLTRIPA